MFTGIVEKIGTVTRRTDLSEAKASGAMELEIETGFSDLELGESVAINGVCLTVSSLAQDSKATTHACFYVSPETIACTSFGSIAKNDLLNLERSLTLNKKISGHWVLGHVDGSARLLQVKESDGSHFIDVEIPRSLLPYCVPKGSIALDGVSLTLNSVDEKNSTIQICLIPHTWDHTRFHSLSVGSRLNVEADYLAKLSFHQSKYASANVVHPASDSRIGGQHVSP